MNRLIALYIVFSFTVSSASWNQFQGNSAHTGYLPVIGPDSDVVNWQYNIGADVDVLGGPSVGFFDGSQKVVVGAADGVHIISPAGYKIDFIPTSEPVTNVVAIADNTLFFSVGDSLFAYRPDSLRWAAQIDGYGVHVSTRGDAIYVCDEDHIIKYTTDGLQLWQQSMRGDVLNAAPAIDDQGRVYCVTTYEFGAPIFDFWVYAFLDNGASWWDYDYGAFDATYVRTSPTVDQSYNVYVLTHAGRRTMQSYANGSRNWLHETPTLMSSPALRNNTLFYGVDSGLQTRTTAGAQQWTYVAAGRVTFSSPAVDVNGSIYFGSDNGQLTSLTSSGSLRWNRQLSGPLGSPALGDDGTLYICSQQTLYAFGSSGLGVPVTMSEAQFCLWPNPVKDGIVFLRDTGDEPFSVSIYNAAGRLVGKVSSSPQSLNVGLLASGVYFLQLNTNHELRTASLVVQR